MATIVLRNDTTSSLRIALFLSLVYGRGHFESVKKMRRLSELDSIFIVFHFFGQTAYIPSKVKYFKQLMISSIGFKLIYLAMALTYAKHQIQQSVSEYRVDKHASLRRYIGVHIVLLACFTLYESIASPHLSRQICEHFGRIMQYMHFHLDIQLQMKNFKHQFAVQFLPILLLVVFRFFAEFYISGEVGNINFLLLVFVHVVATFHFVLFVCLIDLLLHSINIKLMSYLRFEQLCMRIIIVFRYLKWIHYNLWSITRVLNRSFGAMLTTLFMHNFFTMVYSGCRLFLSWHSAHAISK